MRICALARDVIPSLALGVVLVSCDGPSAGGGRSALPVGPTLTIDGFPVSIREYALPPTQQNALRNLVVGPDGAIWLSAGTLQMDRVTGNGMIDVFTAPSAPPTNPEGTWSGFFQSISYAGNVYTEFSGEGGIWNHPYSLFLARVTIAGNITPDTSIGADELFGGMVTDSSGGLWVYVVPTTANGNLSRLVWNGVNWIGGPGCEIDGDPSTLAFGPDGNLHVAATSVPGDVPIIYKVSPSCKILAVFRPPTSLRSIARMTAGPDGALWLLERGAGLIGHLTTAGVYTELQVPYHGSLPVDITQGSDGAIWFTDAGTNAIGRVTSAGVFSEFPIPTPNALGGSSLISCPRKCDGAHGRIWFTEPASDKIGRLEF